MDMIYPSFSFVSSNSTKSPTTGLTFLLQKTPRPRQRYIFPSLCTSYNPLYALITWPCFCRHHALLYTPLLLLPLFPHPAPLYISQFHHDRVPTSTQSPDLLLSSLPHSLYLLYCFYLLHTLSLFVPL